MSAKPRAVQTSSSDSGVGTPTYDAHGNTKTMGTQTLTYDGSDRHTGTTTGTTSVSYVRDATGRIISRTEAGSSLRYGFNGPGDSSAFTTDASGATVQDRTVGLVGGVLLAKRSTGDVWSYPNIHGDMVATADPAGAKRGGTIAYDPSGQALTPNGPTNPDGVPDNSGGNLDYGWLGQAQRGLEHAPGIATIEMGARPYVPGLGRFLQVDPVEGGSCSDYDYVCGDPVNNLDLDGLHCEKTKTIIDKETGEKKTVSHDGHYKSIGCRAARVAQENRAFIRASANVLSTVSTISAFGCVAGVGCVVSLATGASAAALYFGLS